MSKNDTDILLIRKYLNGELDAKAMHQLERRAQEDPFLMDAIEGYAKAGNDQHKQLEDIGTRLHNRVAIAERTRVIPWRIMGIAASVIFVLFAGELLLFFNKGKQVSHPVAAVKAAPAIDSRPAAPTPQAPAHLQHTATLAAVSKPHVNKRVPEKRVRAEAAPAVKTADALSTLFASSVKPDSSTADSTPLNELVVMSMAEKNQDHGAASKRLPIDAVVKGYAVARKNDSSSNPVHSIPSKAAGVGITSPANNTRNNESYFYQNSSLSSNLIRGRVIDKIDGLPIPGVSVKIAGTDKATRTDANGRFKLNTDSSKADNHLVLRYIGYQTANVPANSRDSLNTIAMVPANNSLNEVVVTRRVTGEDNTHTDYITRAHPANGWASFNQYLKENARSSDRKVGIVKVSFAVDSHGVISGLKVMKSLSAAADQKSLELITNGPAWVAGSSNGPQTVTVRIKFEN